MKYIHINSKLTSAGLEGLGFELALTGNQDTA